MNEILQGKGLVEIAEDKVQVTGLKGPLEEGKQHKVESFAARIPIQADRGFGRRLARNSDARDGRRSGCTACARKHGCHSSRERPGPVTINRG
jgi:hypothetical protein